MIWLSLISMFILGIVTGYALCSIWNNLSEKVVYGLDEGDPKGDSSVIVARKRGEEPLVFTYNEPGPLAKCPKCGEICHVDTTGKYAYCVWHKRFPLEEK